MRPPLRDRARGRWRSILPSLGIDSRYLTGKQCGCPVCADGKDRFVFDDKEGRGTWICHSCSGPKGVGAGDGVALVMAVRGLAFKEAAELIEGILGDAAYEEPKQGRSNDDKRDALRRLWRAGTAVRPGDAASRWLSRRVGLSNVPAVIRSVPRAVYHGDDAKSWHPAMIALVQTAVGDPVNLHRTYLTPDGDKAPVPRPRRMMEGDVPPGSAVRLFDGAETMGVAEGIETAFAAASLFGLPVWAAITSSGLQAWEPPPEAREIIVFGDNDPKFGGAAAAYHLAHRLAVRRRPMPLTARVEIPTTIGDDWNDVLLRRGVEQRLEAAA